MNVLLARPFATRLAPAAFRIAAPRVSTHVCHAKKKGGKKKGGKTQKKSGSLMDGAKAQPRPEKWKSPEMFMQLFLAIESYR